ncbi:MAG: RNA polymerase sigma factor [Phycisphaerales bacterium]|nr:RNA polymerase sigma factor [Phycisphaerales bacterium]
MSLFPMHNLNSSDEPARVQPVMSRAQSRDQGAADFLLMQRVAESDREAVSELYERFGSLVFRMSLQTMPTRQEAEDAVQEIFVRLWRTADRYDNTKAALVTWIMLISRRHLVDKLRRRRARIRPSSLDESMSGALQEQQFNVGTLEKDERYRAIWDRISTLPELQQTVVIRAYLGGQTLRQISFELGVPIGTIKSALSRALVRLRQLASEEADSGQSNGEGVEPKATGSE